MDTLRDGNSMLLRVLPEDSAEFPETPGVVGLARHVQPHAYIKDADWPKFVSWPSTISASA